MYIVQTPVGEENPYYGCDDCLKRRKQRLKTRDSLKSNTSRFFLTVGTVVSGGHSLTLDNNVFVAGATGAGCGFLCGILTSALLGWCYEKCFLKDLKDRHCQHVRVFPLYVVDNLPPDAQASQVPAADSQTNAAPPVDNDDSRVCFITNRKRFREQFSEAIKP